MTLEVVGYIHFRWVDQPTAIHQNENQMNPQNQGG